VTDDAPALPPGLPAEAVETFRELLQEPPQDPLILREQIERKLETAREEAARGTPVDLELAERLAATCKRLLEVGVRPRSDPLLIPRTSSSEERLILAAIRYFVLTLDAEDDLLTPGGLQDDAQVLDAVLRHLGRTDLASGLP
jgi:hypothetical protein